VQDIFPWFMLSSVVPIASGRLKNLGRVRPPPRILRYAQGDSNQKLSGKQAKGKGINTLPINKGESKREGNYGALTGAFRFTIFLFVNHFIQIWLAVVAMRSAGLPQ